MDKHEPIKLNFYSLAMYNYSGAEMSFQSTKGHRISVAFSEDEIKAMQEIIEAGKKRALKEIPEMIAEVIAEERVSQILAKREQDALELTNQTNTASSDEEILF